MGWLEEVHAERDSRYYVVRDWAGKLRKWQVTRAGTRWRGHGAVSLYLKQGRCGLERRMLHEVGVIVRFVVPKKLCLDSCRMSW